MSDDSKSKPPVALTNAVSWRAEGIKHKKNEIFLDVVEKVNLLVAANGTVLHSGINGAVKMRSFLSGMPELKLGLNDKIMFESTGRNNQGRSGKSVEMEDIKFHQCVRLARFENDRTISFIPPDGEFDLMTYRLDTHVKPLIWVEAVVEPHRGSRIEYRLRHDHSLKVVVWQIMWKYQSRYRPMWIVQVSNRVWELLHTCPIRIVSYGRLSNSMVDVNI